ncbi:MAG: exo-alpha-sialidase [Anaerolineae bacterium]|nr:MAG: exo-alpha-sialidase [Anaerolineae bacterium]
MTPAIACDAFGLVHVFWSERTQGEPSEFPGRDTGDSIFYRQLRDGEWSPAIDVAFADEGESFLLQPVAGTDSDGTVYLVWSGYRGIYFSYAPIVSATMAAAWSPPVLVVPVNPIADFSGPVKRPRLVVDEVHHSLHVIYSLYGTNGNLFYLRSPDMGQTWDEPRPLTDVTQARAADEVNANGRIILDQAGNLHVIWDYVVKQDEDWLGQVIKHVTSTDNGETWSTPSDVAVAWQGARWWGVPDIVATSDKLHIVFACGDRPRRCYTYSRDGGQTWERPQPLFGDFMSLAGWDSMTVDMNDTVHLIAQLRDLESQTYVWHAALGDDRWPAEPFRTPLEMWMADHFPESCTSLGNGCTS